MKLLRLAILLVLVCLATLAFADKPPQVLFEHVTTTAQLMHRGECDVESMKKKDVPCLIFYNRAQDIAWLVLFDTDGSGQPSVTHVIAVTSDLKEKVIWCRSSVCT